MEYMENQAQMQLEGGPIGQAYRDGMMKAAEILRNGAAAYDANDSKKVHYNIADGMAAALMRSWANGIEIEANKS